MKIALSFPGCHGRGGVERLLLETANYLVRQGHDVHVLAGEFDVEALDARVMRHSISLPKRPALLQMITYARRSPLDLHALHADIHGAFGVICPSGGVVNVQSVHAAWLDASRRLRSLGGRFRQACNPIHPFIISLEQRHFGERRYRKLVAPTAQVKSDLMRFYQVAESDVVIIPNGFCDKSLNAVKSRRLRPEIRKTLGYRDDDFVVLFVGNELERKGFGPLLHAIAALKNRKLRLLAVVGRVSVAAYRAEARRLGLGGHVHFTGSQRDLAPYYAAADMMALATQYEAWGLVIVEALACGTPVLASRLAGAASAIDEGKTGELLENPLDVREIAEKINLMAWRNGSMERHRISASVARYSWDSVLKDYESVLKNS